MKLLNRIKSYARQKSWDWYFRQKYLRLVPEEHKELVKVLLDNLFFRFNSPDISGFRTLSMASGVLFSPNKLEDIFFRSVCSVVPNITMIDFCGVQPMQAPVETIGMLSYGGDGNDTPGILEFKTKIVEAISANSNTSIAVELLHDILSTNNEDVTDEIIGAVSSEVARFYNYTLRDKLFDKTEEENVSTTVEKLPILLDRYRFNISSKTRRGSANRILVSPDILYYLKNSNTNRVQWIDETDVTGGPPTLVGRQFSDDGRTELFRVYVDSGLSSGTIFMAYSGVTEVDSGVFFSPYMLLDSKESIIMNAGDVVPNIPIYTRFVVTDNYNASSYFVKLKVTIEE